ncbi:MAG: zinc ribbon domain-containing protein [Candidatus Korarchaeota archaeon]|nr:zinc ribbon domain-containing protein [Candidatus Korarchaeota archaeon]
MSGDPRQKATDRVAGTIVVSVDGLPFRDMQKAQFTANSCIQCGKRLPPNAKYCPHCGKEQE